MKSKCCGERVVSFPDTVLKVQYIKALRAKYPVLGLFELKTIADQCAPVTKIYKCNVCGTYYHQRVRRKQSVIDLENQMLIALVASHAAKISEGVRP